jgi:DNA-binding HxlR family transcriptional regulator
MLKTTKAIKRDILSKFRSQLEDHDTISPKWLQEHYWQLLTSKEKNFFDQAVSDLAKNGLIEKVKGSNPTLRLTDKGADLIC